MFGQDIDITFFMAQFLLFIAVVMIFYSLKNIITERNKTARRLVKQTKINAPEQDISLSLDNNKFKLFEKYLMPEDPEKINELRAALIRAGYRERSAVRVYYTYRVAISLGALLFSVLLLPLIMTETSLLITISAMLLIIIIAYFSPRFWVERAYQYRRINIEKGFPDALDLLVVCTEAGLSLDAAIQKVTSEIGFSHPVLATELSLVVAEIRAGIDRKIAFTGLANRTGVEAIRGLMSSINQSMRFGSSIAETLRIYSDDFRDKRMQEAEEKAATIGSKLIFPTALCLLPCFIMIIIVPFGMNLIKVFKDM